jgi:hypothetical protein
MKKLLLSLCAVAMFSVMITSCSASKKDCQGTKHYKMKNGIYL